VLLALFTLGAALPAREPTKQELLVEIDKKLRAANKTAGPCVACVVVSRSDRYPRPSDASERPGRLGDFDPRAFLKANPTEARLAVTLDLTKPDNILDHGYACGVVIDRSGLILTPYHVVEGATKIYVHLPDRPGSYADIHAADSRHDLAVLKLINPPADKPPAINLATVHVDGPGKPQSGLSNGKLTVLMANAYTSGYVIDKPGAALGSVTSVKWATDRVPGASDSYYTYGPLIEHDAKLGADVSGAALLNLDGELIGLTTTAAGLAGGDRTPGYAMPVDENFRHVVEVLRRGEEVEYGYIGVILRNGLSIEQVAPLGPAWRAGVRSGDTITRVNGIEIKTYGELLHRVGSGLAGERINLTVNQLGQPREVGITLGKFDHKQPFIASVRPEPVFGLRIDYGSILAQAVRLNPQVELRGVPDGVSVREVSANSPAATAFKKIGDVPQRWLVTHVNGTAVGTPAEFYKAAKDQKSVKLTVIDPTEKDRKEREVTLP
jgi:serine protease Do